MAWIARAKVVTPSDIIITYSSGPAASFADAAAELTSILNLVVGTTLSVSMTQTLDPTQYLAGGVAPFEDAEIVLFKVGTLPGTRLIKSRKIENMSLAFKLDNLPQIDTENAAIQSIATNYRDGNGVGGYALLADSCKYKK